MQQEFQTHPGKPVPLGATLTPNGVHFALVSREATGVVLQLYRESRDAYPYAEIQLDPDIHRTGNVWHVEVEGLEAGALYMYRLHGPFDPKKGQRFNPNRPLLDPYARALTADFHWTMENALAYNAGHKDKDLSLRRDATAEGLPKCIVVDPEFDWEDDRPLNYHLSESVIYEAHVRGISRHRSSNTRHPGTFRGVIEMIPYLKNLGVTSLELLPVQEFNEWELDRVNPITGEPLENYWGYNTLAFFAPKGTYAADGGRGEQVREFKEMVRELHKAGIEVILDVVFNHSGEGNELGPTISFRGIDNRLYYMLDENPRYYKNFSGTGNTLNCNTPIMRTLIRECLHYWVLEMHVDGFRFDLGSILGRDQRGQILENPPLLEGIAEDPILQDTKVIAEAWDAGGAYQVGGFPGGRWAEWNDRYRDDVRRYWRGDPKMVSALATRFAGSSDLYDQNGRKPFHSINFVTAHDGFTLRDLVSYNRKHNEANGEHNRDGHNSNFSFNYGAEGETEDVKVNRLRRRQMKNFLTTLLLSLGTPMMLSGDEFGRTQRGNNNAYCHNSRLTWNDYTLKETYADLYRFARILIHLRRNHPAFRRPEFYTGRDNNSNRRADIEWYSPEGGEADWSDGDNCLGIYIDGTEANLDGEREDDDFFLMFNACKTRREFVVPPPPEGRQWVRVIDTGREPPEDIRERQDEEKVEDAGRTVVRSRSVQVWQAVEPDLSTTKVVIKP